MSPPLACRARNWAASCRLSARAALSADSAMPVCASRCSSARASESFAASSVASCARASAAPRCATQNARPTPTITTPPKPSTICLSRLVCMCTASAIRTAVGRRGAAARGAATGEAARTAGGATKWNVTCGPPPPNRITSPSASARSPSTFCPFTYVPFVLARSCSMCRSPMLRISACRAETSRSFVASNRRSLSGCRPMDTTDLSNRAREPARAPVVTRSSTPISA